jgi:hypothetical protein
MPAVARESQRPERANQGGLNERKPVSPTVAVRLRKLFGDPYCVKSLFEFEGIKNVNTQIGNVGGIARYKYHAMNIGGCR